MLYFFVSVFILIFLYLCFYGGGGSALGQISGQIFATIGESGAGKSFVRMCWVIEYFLPRPHLGYLITNVPLNVDAIAAHFDALSASGRSKVDGVDVRRRLIVLSPTSGFLGDFMDEKGEPQELLSHVDGLPKGAACHLMIDEIHHYCSTSSSNKWKDKWKNVLSTIRKKGCRFEMMTQAWSQVPGFLTDVCEAQIRITAASSRREKWFNIPMDRWYNLRAAITGNWLTAAWVKEVKGFDKSDETISISKRLIDPSFFPFYATADSYDKDDESDAARVLIIKQDWECFSRWEIISNFWKDFRGALIFSPWFGAVCFFVLLATVGVSGPLRAAMQGTVSFVTSAISPSAGNKKQVSEKADAEETPPKLLVEQSRVPVAAAAAVPLAETSGNGSRETPLQCELIDSKGVYYDGLFYSLGQTIETGPATGETIESVDLLRGLAHTSSDRILRLQSSKADADRQPTVSRSVSQPQTSSPRPTLQPTGPGRSGQSSDGKATPGRSGPVPRAAIQPQSGSRGRLN